MPFVCPIREVACLYSSGPSKVVHDASLIRRSYGGVAKTAHDLIEGIRSARPFLIIVEYSYGKNDMRDVWKKFLTVLLIFLVWRGALFAFDFVGMNLSYERTNNFNKDYQAYPNRYFLDGWFRWDTGWYKRIAERGYYIEGQQSNVVFFPLFPYMARYLGYVVGNHYFAGFLLSNFSTLFALFFVYCIALLRLDEEGSKRTLILLLLFPGSFFLSAYYSEGVFLLTSSASTYFFLKRRYCWAGLFGMLAMLTRSTGITLFILFSLVLARDLWQKKYDFRGAMLFLLLIPAGLLIFMYMLTVQVKDPFAFLKFQAGWRRHFVFPLFAPFIELWWVHWSFPRDASNMQRLIDTFCAFAFLVIGVMMFKKKYHPVLWLLVFGGVLMPLSTGRVISMTRFCAVLFPAFFYLAELCENRNVERFIIFTFAFFLSLYNLRFLNWFWAG
jgi:Gpi18-like mannosyltransferase